MNSMWTLGGRGSHEAVCGLSEQCGRESYLDLQSKSNKELKQAGKKLLMMRTIVQWRLRQLFMRCYVVISLSLEHFQRVRGKVLLICDYYIGSKMDVQFHFRLTKGLAVFTDALSWLNCLWIAKKIIQILLRYHTLTMSIAVTRFNYFWQGSVHKKIESKERVTSLQTQNSPHKKPSGNVILDWRPERRKNLVATSKSLYCYWATEFPVFQMLETYTIKTQKSSRKPTLKT